MRARAGVEGLGGASKDRTDDKGAEMEISRAKPATVTAA